MKKILFQNCQDVDNSINNGKVSATFVSELKEAFKLFPPTADMRYKQSFDGKLIISVKVTYENGMSQHFQGNGDADLISAIQMAMCGNLHSLGEYKANEHDIEVAKKDENLVLSIFKQYMHSKTKSYVETDWISSKGERYRRITFSTSFNMTVKFCLKATEEVNNIISEACKPEWLKKAEAEDQAKAEAQPTEA